MSTVAANKIANINKTKEVLVEDLIELRVSNLGLLGSNPTTRPGGAALVIGDSYFNTISQSKITYTATGWVKSLNENDIVDNLSSVSALKALSANQGKVLADAIVSANQSITTLGNNTYTKTQVDNLIKSAAMPVGMIFPWSLSEASIPGGTIPRNGQLLSRATWPQLWALVSAQAVTDAVWLAAPYDQRGKYSSGDGSTTFRMPDTNGKHADGNTIAAMTMRGYGKNSAGTPGVHQADQVQGMRHVVPLAANAASTRPPQLDAEFAWNPDKSYTSSINGTGWGTSYAPATGRQLSDGVNGAPRVGSETRSSNETVIWLTVGANGTTNSGTVDVTALASNVATHSSQIQNLQTLAASNDPRMATAWVRFNGANGAIIGVSYNVNSVIRSSAGVYRVNFTVPMNNANYAPIFASASMISTNQGNSPYPILLTTQYVDVINRVGDTFVDRDLCVLHIFGGMN